MMPAFAVIFVLFGQPLTFTSLEQCQHHYFSEKYLVIGLDRLLDPLSRLSSSNFPVLQLLGGAECD
jgi:hypothetical protein